MCDTIVASSNGQEGQPTLFGKNSDRQANEAQNVEIVPARERGDRPDVACTYLTIPEAPKTHAVLLCRPYWIWGAEMGANEHGVVIGNEGLRARGGPPTVPALTGMDLVRLGLERAASAAEAVTVITALLESYGQGGDCGHLVPAFYHNGFMIADAREAYVLETIGREWMLERVSNRRAISNTYSIDHGLTRQSSGLEAIFSGPRQLAPAATLPSLANDPDSQHIGSGCARLARATALLDLCAADVAGFMKILRDHGPDAGHPADHAAPALCMHFNGSTVKAQTTGSMVSELRADGHVHWVTATAAPCISIFKPVLFGVPLPADVGGAGDQFDMSSLWWRHEALHRSAVAGDFLATLAAIQEERDALETQFRASIAVLSMSGERDEQARTVAECWRLADEATRRWHREIKACAEHSAYHQAWDELNSIAHMPCPDTADDTQVRIGRRISAGGPS